MHREAPGSANAFSPETQVAIARERDNVIALRSDLAARAPERWTSATVSARVPNESLFVITPAIADGTAEAAILADFNGAAVPHTPDGRPSRRRASRRTPTSTARVTRSAGLPNWPTTTSGSSASALTRSTRWMPCSTLLHPHHRRPGTDPGDLHH